MNRARRALLLVPALAACYAYAPPPWSGGVALASPADEPPALDDDLDEVRLRIVEVARGYLGRAFAGGSVALGAGLPGASAEPSPTMRNPTVTPTVIATSAAATSRSTAATRAGAATASSCGAARS